MSYHYISGCGPTERSTFNSNLIKLFSEEFARIPKPTPPSYPGAPKGMDTQHVCIVHVIFLANHPGAFKGTDTQYACMYWEQDMFNYLSLGFKMPS